MALLWHRVFWVIFEISWVHSNHAAENFYSKLISKFSSDGQLTRQQFKEFAIDVTDKRLERIYPLNCQESQNNKGCQNLTNEVCFLPSNAGIP